MIRVRVRYGSIRSQHHGAITTAGVYHEPVKNLELARLFNEMARLLEVQNESVFRVRAYARAAQTLETLAESVEAVAARGELGKPQGIGRDLAAKIEEYLATRRIAQLEELRRGLPPTFLTLLEIRRLGPKTAKQIYDAFRVQTIEELEALQPKESRTIEITKFVDLDDIDPLFYDKPYYLAPGERAAKPIA